MTPAEPTSRTLDVTGLRAHCLDWGDPGAPPVACVRQSSPKRLGFHRLSRYR